MSLYPAIEPYKTGRIQVSERHEIYFEEVGNPQGQPIVFVHGGPGGGSKENDRRFFDPQKYRIILFDQRGSGRSQPFADLSENTTWDLVEDMEKIRAQVGIDQWMVFGGSWGSTLSLAYAVTHPLRVKALILRGIFLCRTKEFDWLYQLGANRIFPEGYQEFIAPIPEAERDDLLLAFHKRLTGDDEIEKVKAAQAWSIWEAYTSKLIPDPEAIHSYGEAKFATAFARIEAHYFVNNGFFENEHHLLDLAQAQLQDIPCDIIHGRYDMVCPIENAFELKERLPKARFHIVPDAGHSSMEAPISAKLVEVTDRYAQDFPN